LHAAEAAARAGFEILLVGEERLLRRRIERQLDDDPEALGRISLKPASGRIEMGDKAAQAIRGKAGASMPIAFDAVVAGEADAVVSAGHSGAMLACGLFKFGRINGVDRPAIAAALPRAEGRGVLLDVGANVECRPEHLIQFAAMGSAYARIELGRERPRVGLLSNGTESGKGTSLTRAADEALRGMPSTQFDYRGYVEGGTLLRDEVDVVVTDGFSGNVALKVLEGTALSFAEAVGPDLLTPALQRHFRPDSYGGAPLLGVNGVAVIAHGASTQTALFNAIKLAAHFVAGDLTGALRDAIARHASTEEAARSGLFSR
jgi:glycerol-3-phosphate acyltransferase PlsX